ncbi:MAG: efflux RND transporter periplasmic adaptor subunit [Myxococcota bacterium]|nr:efflux RND transporter periplasmic adaptor subunit [Myxococcota bacterium]
MTTATPDHDLDGLRLRDPSGGRPAHAGADHARNEAPGSPIAPPRRRAWRIAAAIGLACSLSTAAVCRHVAGHERAALQYGTAPVTRRDLFGRITATGTVSALVTVQIGTQVSGRIEKLNADFNSSVTKGQLVAKLDSQLFEAAVQQAQANYLLAKAGLSSALATSSNADKQAARSRALHEKALASATDLDNAEAIAASAHASLEGAQASVAQAAAQLRQARINLSYTTIVAPIDGVVISRNVDVGQTVAASLATPTLFSVAHDLTKMQLDTNVAEGDVGRLRTGIPTYFTVDAFPEQRFFGVVRQIRNAPTTVQSVVTYDAVIDVDNGDLRLRPGMTATVTFVYAQSPHALAVPNAALRFRPAQQAPVAPIAPVAPGAKTLWTTRSGALEPVVVQTGLADGALTEILGDTLNEGDEVVVQEPGGSAAAAARAPLQPGRPPPLF